MFSFSPPPLGLALEKNIRAVGWDGDAETAAWMKIEEGLNFRLSPPSASLRKLTLIYD